MFNILGSLVLLYTLIYQKRRVSFLKKKLSDKETDITRDGYYDSETFSIAFVESFFVYSNGTLLNIERLGA